MTETAEVPGQLPSLFRIKRIVATIQRIYAVVLILLCLMLVLSLGAAGPSRLSIGQWVSSGLWLEIVAFIYLGLRFRRRWAMPLIVISSASIIMLGLIAGNPRDPWVAIILRAWAVGALYQLCFFTRRDTEQFFGASGTTVF